MGGHLSPIAEQTLKGLAELRNRMVHGDLTANACVEDVNQVLAAVNEALSVEAP